MEKSNLANIEAEIADWNTRRNAWKWSRATPFEPLRSEIFCIIEKATALYAVATAEERQYMRQFPLRYLTIGIYFQDYIAERVKELTVDLDSKSLTQGLLAFSILDGSGDYREDLITLGSLYIASVRAGIDPRPYLKAVSVLSSSHSESGHTSTQDMISNFEDYAYFKEDVLPQLAELP